MITAGGVPRKLAVPGEEAFTGKGVSYCALCDGAFFRGKPLAVVGGGTTADATIAAVMAEKYLEAQQLRLPWR